VGRAASPQPRTWGLEAITQSNSIAEPEIPSRSPARAQTQCSLGLAATTRRGPLFFGCLTGDAYLEHFPTGMNRWGFPKRRESASSCMLAKEVSMYGQGAFR
jgi:hypothetical protein